MNTTSLIYAFMLILGISFYIAGILQLINTINDIQDSAKILKIMSQMSFSFKVKEINVIEEEPSTLRINGRLLLNITWREKVSQKGPIIRFTFTNKTLSEIIISSLDKPVIDREVSLDFKLRKNQLREKIYMNISIESNLGLLSISQPVLNVTQILSWIGLGIDDLSYSVEDNKTYLSFYISAQYRVSVPVDVVIMDDRGTILVTHRIDKLDLRPGERQFVNIELNGVDRSSIASIELRVYGVKVLHVKLRGGG